MKISMIAAVDRNGGIGKNNALVWHEPQDQRHFRATTMGCPVLMGRKTWDSLPARFKPLPGRRNLVLTRNPALQLPGAETAPSVQAALDGLRGTPKVFVMGGADVYAQALHRADELVLTEIDAVLPADVFFPRWQRSDWVETSRQPHTAADGTAFAFVTYQRKTHQE